MALKWVLFVSPTQGSRRSVRGGGILPQILIGDSGQRDPEIYLKVIQAHAGRIPAAFIRDVTPDVRDRTVARIIEEAKTAGAEMFYVRDSSEVLAHVSRLGL